MKEHGGLRAECAPVGRRREMPRAGREQLTCAPRHNAVRASHMPSPPSPSDRAEEESAQSLTAERPPLSQPVGLEALMRL